MGFPVTQGAFNLLEEKWIPVLYGNGTTDRVGICQALTDAHKIRQIAATNPMDRVALLRFLLAVLMWCKEDAKSSLAGLDEKSTGIPENWLAKLKENKAAFNLLGDGKRFYQDQTSQNKEDYRPIGDLLVEFPTETKTAHFRHVRDKEYGFCPACCALGIIRFCSWANAYAGGRYTAAVNGPTPAYAIRTDKTLLRTFFLNCPGNMKSNPKPPWLWNESPQENELDAVIVFAWRSRKLWLDDPEVGKCRCSYCGEAAYLIRKHAFTGNWKAPFSASGSEKKFWQHDPHLVFVEKAQSSGGNDDTEEVNEVSTEKPSPKNGNRGRSKQTTLGFPSPGAEVATHARFWRRALSASNMVEDAGIYITVTGPAANKGLYQDAASVYLPRNLQSRITDIAGKAVEDLRGILFSTASNPGRKQLERRASFDSLSPFLEACLKQALPSFEKAGDLKDILLTVARKVVSATSVGSPLKRREALARTITVLETAMINAAKREKPAEETVQTSNTEQFPSKRASVTPLKEE